MTITTEKLLFGTTNRAKLDRLRAVLRSLPVEVVGLDDVGVSIRVDEDGGTPHQNAELLEHYCRALFEVGGESPGYWSVSVAFAVSKEMVFTRDFREETYFTLPPSPVLMPGAPLSSIQFDPTFGKYKSEITPKERESLDNAFDQQLFDFLSECVAGIPKGQRDGQ